MLKFCPCFICISSAKMRKWFRIFKERSYFFFNSIRAFKGELQMQISESQVRDYSSLHLKWMLLNKNNKINKKQIVQFFSPLFPSYILFSFCEKINESQIFPAFFTYK
jgi:hypothetical protein